MIKNYIFAGIGSRKTPENVLNVFTDLATSLASIGIVLRSGGADGADKAFETGCDKMLGPKEIYLPWKNFNGSTSNLYLDNLPNSKQAEDIAKIFHTHLYNCSDAVKKLMTRNTFQVLGPDLNEETYSDFIICYTEKGLAGGETGQALRIAADKNIAIFDAGSYSYIEEFIYDIKMYLKNKYQINLVI